MTLTEGILSLCAPLIAVGILHVMGELTQMNGTLKRMEENREPFTVRTLHEMDGVTRETRDVARKILGAVADLRTPRPLRFDAGKTNIFLQATEQEDEDGFLRNWEAVMYWDQHNRRRIVPTEEFRRLFPRVPLFGIPTDPGTIGAVVDRSSTHKERDFYRQWNAEGKEMLRLDNGVYGLKEQFTPARSVSFIVALRTPPPGPKGAIRPDGLPSAVVADVVRTGEAFASSLEVLEVAATPPAPDTKDEAKYGKYGSNTLPHDEYDPNHEKEEQSFTLPSESMPEDEPSPEWQWPRERP